MYYLVLYMIVLGISAMMYLYQYPHVNFQLMPNHPTLVCPNLNRQVHQLQIQSRTYHSEFCHSKVFRGDPLRDRGTTRPTIGYAYQDFGVPKFPFKTHPAQVGHTSSQVNFGAAHELCLRQRQRIMRTTKTALPVG